MNVSDQEILGSAACMGSDNEPSEPLYMQFLKVMKVGRPYRPHKFNNLKATAKDVSVFMTALIKNKLVEQKNNRGLIQWVRIK